MYLSSHLNEFLPDGFTVSDVNIYLNGNRIGSLTAFGTMRINLPKWKDRRNVRKIMRKASRAHSKAEWVRDEKERNAVNEANEKKYLEWLKEYETKEEN